ncbi:MULTISPECIES: hypothetical protein [Streptomyces]|uniref:hypothetical protein n=1 Tax=Streptomyces TaxID=1883 RepID=UPI001E5496B9|nr:MULTISPECIES: hypothetical protein [Streptomyces]UFQ17064.1 hypothetical protein J2N69_19790 [Streptomyces huasconensis]WCL86664.1 hypothetical protein PPN52_19795 [Streptomyces sp. JCM 35825]
MSERERDEQGGSEHHGGNGNVNHGPEDGSDGPRPAGGTGSADSTGPADGPGSDEPGPHEGGPNERDPHELGPDELALRRMMREAVRELEPSERSLDHLRHAVPARRARKRQAVVGLAAAALFIGTAVPALVHVTNSRGGSDDRPSIAGNSQEAQGGSSQGKDPEKGRQDAGKKPGKSKEKDKKGKKDKKEGKGKGGTGGGGTGSPDPDTSEAATSPVCAAAQLGATGSAGPAEADNKVYGSFRVTNISGSSCTVQAAGVVSATAQGAADPAKIGVASHMAGDGAAALPDPSLEAGTLVLQPGAAYEVRFAWVPSEACPTTGGEPTPDPTPTEGTTPESGSEGMEAQLGRTDGTVADGSVVVTLTPEAGSPSAGATVPNACAGTVYRTGILPAS